MSNNHSPVGLLHSAAINHGIRFSADPAGGNPGGGASAAAAPQTQTIPSSTAAASAPQPEPWVGEWKDSISAMRAAGYSPAQALASLRANGQPQAHQPQTQKEPGGEEKPLTQAEVRRMLAEETHRGGRSRESAAQAKFLERITKIEGLSDAEREVYKYAAQGWLAEQQGKNLYPEGHALRDSYLAPLEDKSFEDGWAWLEKNRTANKAGALAAIGDAARAKQPATPTAGNQGNQGAPKTEQKSTGPIDKAERRKRAEAIAERTFAAAGAAGGTMTAAGA